MTQTVERLESLEIKSIAKQKVISTVIPLQKKKNENHDSLSTSSLISFPLEFASRKALLVFVAAVFLVSVPVFIEAPLVRLLPWLSVALTVGW